MNPIKVLIADDETIVRTGLKATINWKKYNMEVIADVPNGEKGWHEFLTHSPDVIITDIVMPVVGGIEFANRIKEHSPATKILLLSCHQDFEYAQEGMRLGASGYLVKTSFNEEELAGFLRNFQEEIMEERGKLAGEFQISTDHWPAPMKAAVKYIIEHLSTPILVSEVAEIVGLSRSHFSTLFKKTAGESFHAFIDRMKMDRAMELLELTQAPIQDVAEQIGMMDSKYFSKWFKKTTGFTPTEYRLKQKDTNMQTK
ncbi:response regulator transcription factor [Lederbergia citrea]|uniref:Response regulator n=1 Tax=Lederbergia citrea TaxID=2833581 RepID=A0A942UPW8_9BACI|nr:response regulator [Lederbergia citrea]MBS4202581.1 response regulator [Lederbergia citrea]MBS4222753.1 response regulator [Lederbergia citrea]